LIPEMHNQQAMKKSHGFEKFTSGTVDPGVHLYYLKDDGQFPNNSLPVLHYEHALDLPALFPGKYVRSLFAKNDWRNAWASGVFTFHHYHSVTHEVMGIIHGETDLLLGGDHGVVVTVRKGDVLILPAGTAHKNLRSENAVKCIGAYPHNKNYDMQYGRPGERPATDKNIENVAMPSRDPVYGKRNGILKYWTSPTEMPYG
jgi:uncharacterized protein YjlB